MRFFGRKDEIAELHNIRNLSLHTARFTIVTGRRRSGKTSLLLKAYEDVEDLLYFFVARKSEEELCKDFVNEIKEKLHIPILGDVSRFADIFKYLLQLSKTRPLTIIIDEFQDFKRVNSSVFSDMQKIWDINKQDAHVNLVVCGSIYSLMNIIFKNNKQPLYGRQTGEIKVTPFPPSVIKEILCTYNSSDDTWDYLRKSMTRYRNIVPIHLTKNVGGAGGFNQGIKCFMKESLSEYVWIMDDDTIPNEDALLNLIKQLNVTNNVGFWASNVRWRDNSPAKMNIPKASENWNEFIEQGLTILL